MNDNMYTADLPHPGFYIREEIEAPANQEVALKLSTISKKTGISMTHLALGWCALNPNVSTVILGASRLEQLKDNLEAVKHLKQIHEIKKELDLI